MQASDRLQVLCVDDEPAVLEGLEDTLHRRYHVASATSGSAALERLRQEPRTAVIISDMRMPIMNGATFLGLARGVAPNATRILLTGQTDLDAAVSAINTGQIFRFLSKPCSPPELLAAVDAAAEHHRLIISEKVLLEHTLRGSIKMLTNVLSLANPTAFGRATRIKESAGTLARAIGTDSVWAIEVAAMLSQVAYVALPETVTEK
jgi:DNA-binding NtrC family response regulator